MPCPQFAVDWVDEHTYASGGADGVLYFNEIEVGSHSGPISALSVVAGFLISGSWDKTVKVWNIRSRSVVAEYADLSSKVLRIANDGISKVFCGCTERVIFTFDTRQLDQSETLPTLFPYQTRSIAANQKLLAIGAYEGRVAIDSISGSSDKYAFKAHFEGDSVKVVYPVNTMEFRPHSNNLATGGSNGSVVLWDVQYRGVDQTLGDELGNPWPTSISSLSFSRDGQLLVVAVSYCFERGETHHEQDELIVYRSHV